MWNWNLNNLKFKILAFLVFFLINAQEGSLEKQKEWWETTTIYQIYPMSYRDSNLDGTGDLNGIYEKLDYIKDIGIETIWVQPFYLSPMADNGYDVADFYKVQPVFGTLDDVIRLIKGIHKKGMKIILDFVPNHVSDESEWFLKSVDRIDPYTDFFLWHDGKMDEKTGNKTVPNNWLSIFGGTGWEWNEKRNQYYFKQFSKKQPDLNFRCPEVREAMKNVLRFWLDLGVDGFRIDAVKHLLEDERLLDEPYAKSNRELSGYEAIDHIYTVDQEDTYQLTHEWRELLDEYKKKDGISRIMCTEAYSSLPMVLKYFGNATYKNAHFPFNFGLIEMNNEDNATSLDRIIHDWYDNVPPNGVSNWVMSNHDNARIASRLPAETIDAMNMLQLLLPGVASVYYGDEIGMTNTMIRRDQTKDPNNAGAGKSETRDAERTPMQWDDSLNAGFTDAEVPWLPVNPNYWRKNVKSQLKDPDSHLNIFKQLMALRKTDVIKDGDLQTCVLGDWTYMTRRSLEGHNPVLTVINLGTESESICAHKCLPYAQDVFTVTVASRNSGYKAGDTFIMSNSTNLRCSMLRPKAGLVLTSVDQKTSGGSAILPCSLLLLTILSSKNFL